MRTTLDLPDELFRRLKARAALEGTSLKQLLKCLIESEFEGSSPRVQELRPRSSLPVIPRRNAVPVPDLTAELQAQLQERDDLAKLDGSIGR